MTGDASEGAPRVAGHPALRRSPTLTSPSLTPCADYPHPIIAREGWPFLGLAVAVALVVTWFGGWWSIPFWLVALFMLQFFRDPPRDDPAEAGCRAVAGRRAHRRRGQGARSLPRARCAQDQRVHERVQRALEPQPGGRRGASRPGITPAASSTPRWTRPRSRTSAMRCTSSRPTGATSPACRWPA